MNEVAVELGCDWHTVNDAVIAYGSVLVDDPARIGPPTALGLDEVAFGLTSFRNHRIRVLLHAGRPNWDLLATITPR